jgi:hypothetical protein
MYTLISPAPRFSISGCWILIPTTSLTFKKVARQHKKTRMLHESPGIFFIGSCLPLSTLNDSTINETFAYILTEEIMGGQSSKEVGEPVGIGHTERKISKEMKYAKATYDDTSTAKYGSQSPKASEHGRPDSSKEFAERTVFSPNFLSMTVGKKEGRTVEIKYAYRSQRGFYPESK